MTTLPPPAPAQLLARTEFSVTLAVPPDTSPHDADVIYRYEYREANVPSWAQAQRVESKPGDREVVLDDLNPTSSYEVRIYAVRRSTGDSAEQVSLPSEVAAVDTEVPGCTPESKCVLM